MLIFIIENQLHIKLKKTVKLLLDEIKKNKTITLQEFLKKLKEKYKDIHLTNQIFMVIQDNIVTLKMIRIRDEHMKRFSKNIDINSKIKEFYEAVKKYKIEDIICIDETSIKSLQKKVIVIVIKEKDI